MPEQISKETEQNIRQQIDQQKDVFAEKIQAASHVIHKLSDNLREEKAGQVADYVDRLAGRTDSFHESVRGKGPYEIYKQVEEATRRNPLLAFGVAVAAGIFLSRFSKTMVSDRPKTTEGEGSEPSSLRIAS